MYKFQNLKPIEGDASFRRFFRNKIKNLYLFDDNKNIITLVEWPQIIQEKPKKFDRIIFRVWKRSQN